MATARSCTPSPVKSPTGNLTMSGFYNTVTGFGALFNNNDVSYNTATGLNALLSNTSDNVT